MLQRIFRVCLVGIALATLQLGSTVYAHETTTYSYDALGRLVGLQMAGTVNNGHAVSATYDAAGNRTAHNVSTTPTPKTISIGNAAAPEGSILYFSVTLSSASPSTITVNFSTANGTAVANSDYHPNSGTLTFTPGQTTVYAAVGTIDDTTIEFPETLYINLSSPSGATIANGQSTGTIENNDFMTSLHGFWRPNPGVNFYTTNYAEGLNAGFTYSGVIGGLFPGAAPGYHALYRCYKTVVDHFISTQSNCEGQIIEGLMGYASSTHQGWTTPLYRFYKSSTHDHFITTNYDLGIYFGYTYEGLLGYVGI